MKNRKPKKRLVDIEPYEVGVVRRAANNRRFFVVKEDSNMLDIRAVIDTHKALGKLIEVAKSGDLDEPATEKVRGVVKNASLALAEASGAFQPVNDGLAKIRERLESLASDPENITLPAQGEIEALQKLVAEMAERLKLPEGKDDLGLRGAEIDDLSDGIEAMAEALSDGANAGGEEKGDEAEGASGAEGEKLEADAGQKVADPKADEGASAEPQTSEPQASASAEPQAAEPAPSEPAVSEPATSAAGEPAASEPKAVEPVAKEDKLLESISEMLTARLQVLEEKIEEKLKAKFEEVEKRVEKSAANFTPPAGWNRQDREHGEDEDVIFEPFGGSLSDLLDDKTSNPYEDIVL